MSSEKETIIGPGGEAETVDANEVEARAKELGDDGEVIDDGTAEDAGPAAVEGPDPDEMEDALDDAEEARKGAAERLDELARTLEDTPLFAAERDETAEAFELPGGRGWVLPRTLSPEEEREFDEITQGSPRVRMMADGEGIDTIETDLKRRARWQFLVEHAVQEIEVEAGGKTIHLVRGRARVDKFRDLLLHQIHPRFAEYIELKLLDYNGLTSAQRTVRDFT